MIKLNSEQINALVSEIRSKLQKEPNEVVRLNNKAKTTLETRYKKEFTEINKLYTKMKAADEAYKKANEKLRHYLDEVSPQIRKELNTAASVFTTLKDKYVFTDSAIASIQPKSITNEQIRNAIILNTIDCKSVEEVINAIVKKFS